VKLAYLVGVCGIAVVASGCPRAIGPRTMVRDRAQYSESLSDSWKDQTLLNIVKLRYADPPTFVDVGSIVASYTLVQTASVGGAVQSPSGAADRPNRCSLS